MIGAISAALACNRCHGLAAAPTSRPRLLGVLAVAAELHAALLGRCTPFCNCSENDQISEQFSGALQRPFISQPPQRPVCALCFPAWPTRGVAGGAAAPPRTSGHLCGNAGLLAKRARIQTPARLEEIRGEQGLPVGTRAIAARANVTVESLIDDAEKIFQRAMEIDQLGAANTAIKEKGILAGKRIERAEIGSPGEFENMTDDELERALIERVQKLGAWGLWRDAALAQPGARESPVSPEKKHQQPP
jgi:hypothetical protein